MNFLRPVKTSERLPKKPDRYAAKYSHLNWVTTEYFNGTRFEINENYQIEYWYEEIENICKICGKNHAEVCSSCL